MYNEISLNKLTLKYLYGLLGCSFDFSVTLYQLKPIRKECAIVFQKPLKFKFQGSVFLNNPNRFFSFTMKMIGGCNWIFWREILSDNPVLFFSKFQLTLSTKKEKLFISHIVLTIYIEICRIFDKISQFLKIGISTKIFLNISLSPFGSLE
jgi:hypothetical protein